MQKNANDVRETAWSKITSERVGFLATKLDQAQPMTAFTDADARRLYFFTSRSTDLCRDVVAEDGRDGAFLFAAKDQSLHAVIHGAMSISNDQAVIDALWGPVVAAWYNGRNDPELALIAFDCTEGQVWTSEGGPLKFVFEIAKSNLSSAKPDLGTRTHVEM